MDDSDVTTLLAIASIASESVDAGHAARRILELMTAALRGDAAALSLQNPETGKLEIEASLNLPADAADSFAPGHGIPGWSALHGRPLLVPDTATDHRSRPVRPATRCQMAAPLLAGDGQVLGVIAVDRDRPDGFGGADLERLVAFTDGASRVLQRLWELRHLRGKARQLEALIATGQALVAKLAQQELFDTLTRDAAAMLQARAAALYLHDPAAATLRFVSFSGDAVPPSPEGNLPLRACLVAAAVHTRKAVAFSDIRGLESFDLADLPADPSLRSLLAAPMLYEGAVMGVLAVFTDRVRLFDNDEKLLCSALASLGVVAFQNVRLYARVFQSEETLHKNERLTTLGLLAAEIAHEIRNPLTVLKLLHGGLGPGLSEEDPRRTDLRVMGEKLDQLESIVSRVLNFAKAPTSLHARCALADIVDDTLLLIRLKLVQGKIRIHYEAPDRPLVVDGHKGQLQQVLLNLLINSMQAMPEGGEITLTLGSENRAGSNFAVLDVADTGTGIPDSIRDRIFDSFLTGRAEGTGLGLAIAKRALTGHHGDIVLVDSSPAGTRFRITLPLAK